MEAITLKQAIEQAAERGQEVNFGTFKTLEDFTSYYEAHYLSMLQELYDRQDDREKQRLVGFLIEDLNAITNHEM